MKKRIKTRTGDVLENKLANDIHCLVCVLGAAEWDDLKDVVNIPKSNRKAANSQSAADSSIAVYSFADIEELKRTVQTLSVDMVAVKQENINLKSETKSLKKEIKQLRTDWNSALSEIRSFVISCEKSD